MSDLAKSATKVADTTSAVGDEGPATNFMQSSAVNSTEVGTRTSDRFTRSASKGSRKISVPRSCLPPPPPLPPPNPPVTPSSRRSKTKVNLPPPPLPPSGKKAAVSTPVNDGDTKTTERTVCDSEVDKDVDHEHLSCTNHTTDGNDEKSVSCSRTTQNQQTIKTEKFYTVSARDRSIVSCSLSNRTTTVTVSSVMVVDINYLEEQTDHAVTTSFTSHTPPPGANSPKTSHKEVPKPKPRLHRPSAIVSQVGDVMSTSGCQSLKGDRTGDMEVSQSGPKHQSSVVSKESVTHQPDQSVTHQSVTHQRVKPPPPPKKPAVAKLLQSRVNGSTGDSSDDGLTPRQQDSSPETSRPVPPRRTKHKLIKSQQVAAPDSDESGDKMIASAFVTTDVTVRRSGDLAGGSTVSRMKLKHQRMPKMNSFTTEDLDIFQKPNANLGKLEDISDNSDRELTDDSTKKVRKPSVKRSKSAGTNFAGKKPELTVKPQVPEKPKIPGKPAKHKTSRVVQPKDEDSDKSETNENTNTTNTVPTTSDSVTQDAVETKHKESEKSEPNKNTNTTNAVQTTSEDVTQDVVETKPHAKPRKSIPGAEPNAQQATVSKGKKSKQAKVDSVTKTTWFVDSDADSRGSDAERLTDTENSNVDDKPKLVEHSCSVSSTTSASPTRENTDYENVPDNSHIYGNVEIKRNQAGRNDIVDEVGECEWSPLLDTNIPRANSNDMLESCASSENIYEDVDIQDDHEFRRPSLLRTRKRPSRSSHRDEDEDLTFSDDEDYFDDDSFDSDEEFNQELLNQHCNAMRSAPPEEEEEVEPKSKLEHIARELLSTEISYVNKLHLVDQVFHLHIVKENRKCRMFPDEVIPEMFSNIKSIYQFHHDFLLPRLKERMAEWESSQKIGDVMRQFAPFLKLYTEYVKNFDHAMSVITQWQDKSPKFAELLTSLQQRPECGRLTMQHHMLSPIQRVPRYELLLKDYLKHLPDDSNDREDTLQALHLVQTAANQSNEAMQKIEKFKKLLDINDSLIGTQSIISPTREFIKEGKIIKITASSGYLLDRYLFLFSDLLLLCQSLPIGIRQHYRVKAKLGMDGMQILEGDNLETPNTFYVKSKEKTLELHASSMEEKTEWQVAMWNVIADYTKKTVTRKPWTTVTDEFSGNDLGKWAPIWIKDQHATMCMLCSVPFTFRRRRHHCRACGHVVCGSCSAHKVELQYDYNRLNRVCEQCYNMLKGTTNTCISRPVAGPMSARHRGVLQVKGTDPSLLAGFLHMSSDKKTWQKRYYAVHHDFVMYSFKACQDVVAMTSTPLPGYSVAIATEADTITRDHVFKLFHNQMKKVYYFQADDKGHVMRWLSVLEDVVQAKLPADATSPPPKPLPESDA